jgi:Lon protease-like protein
VTIEQIPLFPLRTVLFPGQELPLRIFEERYKVMVGELLESGGGFGAVFIKSGPEVGGTAIPRDVGTTAAIVESQRTDDGRYFINTRGRQRFRIVRMLEPNPYPRAEIRFLDDTTYEDWATLGPALETVRTTFPVYFRLALALSDQWARGLELPRDPHRLVNFLAQWLQTDEESKQRLLEAEACSERLGLLAEVLDGLIDRTRREVDTMHQRRMQGLAGTN